MSKIGSPTTPEDLHIAQVKCKTFAILVLPLTRRSSVSNKQSSCFLARGWAGARGTDGAAFQGAGPLWESL